MGSAATLSSTAGQGTRDQTATVKLSEWCQQAYFTTSVRGPDPSKLPFRSRPCQIDRSGAVSGKEQLVCNADTPGLCVTRDAKRLHCHMLTSSQATQVRPLDQGFLALASSSWSTPTALPGPLLNTAQTRMEASVASLNMLIWAEVPM